MDKETVIRIVVAAALMAAMFYAYQAFLKPEPSPPGERPDAPAESPATPGEETAEGTGEKEETGEAPPAGAETYDLAAVGAAEAAAPVVLGSDLPISRFDLEAEIHPTGAAMRRLTLARKKFFETVADRDLPPVEREPLHLVGPEADEPAMAVEELRLRLEGREGWGRADLAGVPWRVKDAADDRASAVFEVDVQDSGGAPLATVRRAYTLFPRSPAGEDGESVPQYELRMAVEIVARDPRLEQAYYVLHGPPALPREGQRRDYRGAVVGRWAEGQVDVEQYKGEIEGGPRIGPEMAWLGQEDKYFTVVLIPLVPAPDGSHVIPTSPPASGTFAAGAEVSGRTVTEGRSEVTLPVVRLESKAVALEADEPLRHEFVVFAGPKDPDHLEAYYQKIGLDKLVVWSQCCSFFAPISRLLLAVVEALHSVVQNWGVAIILLVILLQIVLLPVTKWSAKSMAEMQRLGPKMQEIREKYANDQKKLQEEMAKIGGFKAFGGCLPMFVQMPIWIGLYGALLVAIQLRHSAFLPAGWIPAGSLFLQDLSAPDALIHWAEPLYLPGKDIPLLGWVIGGIESMLGGAGGITSFNILPIAVGVLMYVQQRLMPMSSSAASANPQMQQQQKMMMRIMPVFLGVVLYSAPSGLCLYITTSSLVRLVESRFFRHRWIEAAKAKAERADAPEPPGEPGKAAARQSRVAGRKKSIGERAEAWIRRKMDEAQKPNRGKGKK
ncbi:MAG: membrane protein insertase YidC [Phycisphaerae bacterium]